MWSFNPKERYKLRHLKKHPWLEGETPSKEEIVKIFTEKEKEL